MSLKAREMTLMHHSKGKLFMLESNFNPSKQESQNLMPRATTVTNRRRIFTCINFAARCVPFTIESPWRPVRKRLARRAKQRAMTRLTKSFEN
jgi:hypothetical protein